MKESFLKEGMMLKEVNQAIVDNGGVITGHALRSFKRGWAMMGFRKRKAHYYVEQPVPIGVITKQGRHRLYESLCGVQGECSDRAPAFEPGGFERCQNCVKLEKKKMPIWLWRKSDL